MDNGRYDQKLDRIDTRLGSIDVTLTAQHHALKEHIRRTELLEKELKPIQKHVTLMSAGLKVIGLGAILAELFYHLTHLFGV